MEDNKIRVGITHGDINGIGYEVILKCFADERMVDLCTPVIYGSSKIAAYHRKVMELPQIMMNQIAGIQEVKPGQVNILNCINEDVRVEIATPSTEAGQAAFLALEAAMADLKRGEIDVLVTAPINKNTIQNENFHFPGHTEYLEKCAGDEHKSLMILLKDNLRVALLTGHIPLSDVAHEVTAKNIKEKVTLLNNSLKQDFGVVRPRIAVLSLNPHAGDGGLLGSEEQDIIIPALKQIQESGILVFGPYPADGFFGSSGYEAYDGVLAMYHDQGLAPFKTIAMEEGVNFTAGLPFVRTSPAHGSAYDIAGQNKASAESFRQAVFTAIDVYRNRLRYEEANAHPLRKQFYDRGNDNEKLDLSKDEEM
ncbi:MAG: 4-hydroxythreonine-4-phosphate dehydrogenase PdxA [Bacteroidales bacterium]|nr:4-hydroxythreonine-4-phosphate dehydrogenase PdxA [Bacteroidales bacterium]